MEKTGMRFCQSCGMPLGADPAQYGTNADGSRNEEYCGYCYAGGKFLFDCSMEEMIEFCLPHTMQADPRLSEEQARQGMRQWFPTLERWKKAEG